MNTVEHKCSNLRWLVKLGCNNRRKNLGSDAGLKRVSHQSLFFLDNMGCASSAPEERRGPLVGGVPTKQGQADQELDAAAAEIQRGASQFLLSRKEEAEKNDAAAEIQRSASSFLLAKRASEAEVEQPKPLLALGSAVGGAMDAVGQLSARIFGGAPASAPVSADGVKLETVSEK